MKICSQDHVIGGHWQAIQTGMLAEVRPGRTGLIVMMKLNIPSLLTKNQVVQNISQTNKNRCFWWGGGVLMHLEPNVGKCKVGVFPY